MSVSYGNNQNDERHESNHEFNMFLDHEIQKKLLDISEKGYDDDVFFMGNSNFIQPQVQTAVKNTNRVRYPKYEEFCSWQDSGKYPKDNVKKPENKTSRLNRERESSNALWKDFKPKEIQYIFKHFTDTAQYIEQYRYDHTYNFGPLSREPIQITTCKIVPLRDTLSPNYRPVSESEHHNPFRRSKDLSHSLTNINNDSESSQNPTKTLDKKMTYSKSDQSLPDLTKGYSHNKNVAPNVVNNVKDRAITPVGEPESNVDTQSVQSQNSSRSENVKSRNCRTPRGLKSSSTYKSTDSKSTKLSSSSSSSANKGISLDTVPKMSPLHILQVKKSGSPLNPGMPLFQGKTMKVMQQPLTPSTSVSESRGEITQ